MPFFEVEMRRVIEWNQTYEADDPVTAIELARLETAHGTVVDEMASVKEVAAHSSNEFVHVFDFRDFQHPSNSREDIVDRSD